MSDVVVTGIGFITSIGNDRGSVLQSLLSLRHGMAVLPQFDREDVPIRLAGTIKGFDTDATEYEAWTYPDSYRIDRKVLRSLAPHGLYSYCAMVQALDDARLADQEISCPGTGLFTASSGSASRMYRSLRHMHERGIQRCSPMWLLSSVAGTLSFNLSSAFSIQGATCGFVSACSSAGHALGYAAEEIMQDRQERMIVVGAEDGDFDSILPFASLRALSTLADPERASCPFDRDRNGFVGTGGAVALVLESREAAHCRGAPLYGQLLGWGQASDGFHPARSHPEGQGLAVAMRNAFKAAGIDSHQIDYVNAHATSTQPGDLSEMQALNAVFLNGGGGGPAISSTKALTGHGLSLASIMEAGFCMLALKEGFMPGSAHIRELDPFATGLNIIRRTEVTAPRVILSNSSGFGGSNVAIVFTRPREWD